jgi:Flp pilus assembly protein TadD
VLALDDGDVARQDRTGQAQLHHPTIEPYLLQSFVLATALHELQHDDGAEEDYRYAITLSPLDPKAHMGFALFLARQGKVAEARDDE